MQAWMEAYCMLRRGEASILSRIETSPKQLLRVHGMGRGEASILSRIETGIHVSEVERGPSVAGKQAS